VIEDGCEQSNGYAKARTARSGMRNLKRSNGFQLE
jgi:hypothetical protein